MIIESSGRSMSTLKRDARTYADQLVIWLTNAPTFTHIRSPPCIATIPTTLSKFLKTIGEISKERSVQVSTLLRTTYKDVTEAAVILTNSTWTDEQLSSLKACTCGQHRRRDNLWARHILKEVVAHVFDVLTIAIVHLMGNPQRGVGPVKFDPEKDSGKRGKWPSSLAELTPHGVSGTLSAFIRWAEVMEAPAPFQTIVQMAYLLPSLSTAMRESPHMYPVIERLLRQLLCLLQELHPAFHNMTTRTVQDISAFHSFFVGGWFRGQVVEGSFSEVHTPQLEKIYNAISDLLPYLTILDPAKFPDKEPLVLSFCSTGIGIHDFLRYTPRPPPPLNPSFAVLLSPYLGEEDLADFGCLLRNMTSLQTLRRCCDPACPETGEDPAVTFKQCAACQAVRYCSKTCQVSDWKAHKQACKGLKLLVPIAEATCYQYTRNSVTATNKAMEAPMEQAMEAGLSKKDLRDLSRYVLTRAEPLP